VDSFVDKRTRNACLGLIALFVLNLPFLFGTYLVFVFHGNLRLRHRGHGDEHPLGLHRDALPGHQAFFGIGAYAAAILSTRYPGFPFPVRPSRRRVYIGRHGVPPGVFGLEDLRRIPGHPTIAFGMIMAEVFGEWASLTGRPGRARGASPGHRPPPVRVCDRDLLPHPSGSAVMFFLGINLISSNTGRAFIAIRENEISAQSFGISLVKYKTLSFAISAFYVGVAGGIYAYLLKYVAPIDFRLLVGIEFVIIVIVGGLGTILGSIPWRHPALCLTPTVRRSGRLARVRDGSCASARHPIFSGGLERRLLPAHGLGPRRVGVPEGS